MTSFWARCVSPRGIFACLLFYRLVAYYGLLRGAAECLNALAAQVPYRLSIRLMAIVTQDQRLAQQGVTPQTQALLAASTPSTCCKRPWQHLYDWSPGTVPA